MPKTASRADFASTTFHKTEKYLSILRKLYHDIQDTHGVTLVLMSVCLLGFGSSEVGCSTSCASFYSHWVLLIAHCRASGYARPSKPYDQISLRRIQWLSSIIGEIRKSKVFTEKSRHPFPNNNIPPYSRAIYRTQPKPLLCDFSDSPCRQFSLRLILKVWSSTLIVACLNLWIEFRAAYCHCYRWRFSCGACIQQKVKDCLLSSI